MRKKTVLKVSPLLVAALLAAGVAVSSAVGLGVEVNYTMGAGVSVTSVCQPTSGTPITVGFGAPTFTAGKYMVGSVNLTNIAAACNGQNVKVTVADSANTVLASYNGTIGGASLTASLSTGADAANVASVAVVIWG